MLAMDSRKVPFTMPLPASRVGVYDADTLAIDAAN